jgi:hypothetical protein
VEDPAGTLPSGGPVGSEFLCDPELLGSTADTESSGYCPAKQKYLYIKLSADANHFKLLEIQTGIILELLVQSPPKFQWGNCYNKLHQKYEYQLFGKFYIYSKTLNLTE